MKKFYLFLIFIFFSFNLFSNYEIPPKISYKKIYIKSKKDFEKICEDNFVYILDGFKLENLPVKEKKEYFTKLLLPAISVVNKEIKRDLDIVTNLKNKTSFTTEEEKTLKKIFSKYKVNFLNWNELEERIIIYPTSLILSQAAIESGWGTSRFFKEGNNIFGVWSLNSNENRIHALETRDNGYKAALRKYDSLKDSIYDFILILSRVEAYHNLRHAIHAKKTPEEIAAYLNKYSEEGEDYVKKVISVLKFNNFEKYDNIISYE